jgi:hypothetical protein
MKCSLCNQDIKNYQSDFHHLFIDDTHSAELCSDCISKFENWRGSVYAKLFPTSTLKKRFEKKSKSVLQNSKNVILSS